MTSIPQRPHRSYSLVEYDSTWPAQFAAERDQLAPLFGDNLIIIEHIGSTSIEGMMAKPQIDILVVVHDLDQVTQTLDRFQAAKYTPRGREYVGNGDEYITKDASDGRRLFSIHVFATGHPQIEQYREFREYLRAHPVERERYIARKRALYAAHRNNYEAYDHGKADLIEDIKERAAVWSRGHLPNQ